MNPQTVHNWRFKSFYEALLEQGFSRKETLSIAEKEHIDPHTSALAQRNWKTIWKYLDDKTPEKRNLQ